MKERSPRDISGSQSRRIGKAKSGGEDKRRSTHLQVSSSSYVPTKRSKILKCIMCDGSHEVRECPQRAALTALHSQVQEERGIGSKWHGEVPRGQELGIGLEVVVPMELDDKGW